MNKYRCCKHCHHSRPGGHKTPCGMCITEKQHKFETSWRAEVPPLIALTIKEKMVYG